MCPLTGIRLMKKVCFVFALTLRETWGLQAMSDIPRKKNQSSQTKTGQSMPRTEHALISPGACSCSLATCPTHHTPSRCRSPQTRRGRAGRCHWRRSSQRAGRCTSRPVEEERAEACAGPAPAPTVRCAVCPAQEKRLTATVCSARC